MRATDEAHLHELIAVARRAVADGVVSVPEHVFLPVEFRVRRWRSEEEYRRGNAPYLVTRDGGSLPAAVLNNNGGVIIWKGVRGDSLTGRLLNNAGAKLVVSNVTGTPAATDAAIVNEIGRKGMDTSFPLIPGESAGGATAAARQFVLRGTFGSSDANGDWRRFWVINNNADEIFDNFSSSQGTKATGQVWELTVTLTLT